MRIHDDRKVAALRPVARTLQGSSAPLVRTPSIPLLLTAVVGLLASALSAHAQTSMLHASGTSIVNANGQTVQLMGVNLGGWLVMEPWMTPADSGGLPDTYSIIQELDSRFGVAEEQSLILTYQQSWITAQDLVNIKNAGFNAVRVPVWWGNFYPIANVSNSAWRSDAFTELDWLVNQCASLGIYVIIDMHGVVGGQSTSDDTGQQNQNQYWTNGNDQGNTAYMWWQIANHYNGNPTVAGYDLINEPDGAPSNTAVINAYASLYSSVRSADPNHMIFIEGTWGNWDWSMLPSPSSEGWTNVVYEMHEYQYNGSESQVEQGSTNQVTDFRNHSSYNCPGYIGEYNDMYNDSSVWNFSASAYNSADLNWTMWSYKSTNALNPTNWGYYGPTYWAATPNVSSDSESTIAADWQQWTTANAFAQNSDLGLSGNENGDASLSTSSWFNVVNQNSGSCVDDAGWGTGNGTIVQQWACGSQQYNQEWQFTSVGNGVYAVYNRNASDEAWNVVNNGTSNGSLMQTWTYGGGSNEQWMPVSLGNGYYKFVGAGSKLCLDTPGASTANGVQLDIYACNGTAAQSFALNAQP
jgi:endoglucanase